MNPFEALGLPDTAALTDRDVRAAWRAIAAATHPDRSDGGDPAAYAAAAAAYAQLRTPWGRTEALADLAAGQHPGTFTIIPNHAVVRRLAQAARHRAAALTAPARLPCLPRSRTPGPRRTRQSLRVLPARVRHGRPGRLALRTAAAAGGVILAVTVTGGTPSAPAVTAGCALWWALTARGDLAPPPGR